jgi:hypothetical protein
VAVVADDVDSIGAGGGAGTAAPLVLVLHAVL